MHTRIKREKIMVFILYLLMLCGISIPNSGVFSGLNRIFSKMPYIEKIATVGSFNFSQTRYSYLVFTMMITSGILLVCLAAKRDIGMRLRKSYITFSFLLIVIAISATLHFEWISVLKCFMYFLIAMTFSSMNAEKRKEMRSKAEKVTIVSANINSICIVFQFFSIYTMTGLNWSTLRAIRCEGIMLDSIVACVLNAFAICIVFFNSDRNKQKKYMLFVLFWIVTGILTGSRTFYLALICIVILKYVFYKNKSKKLLLTVIFSCILLAGLFVAIFCLDTLSSTLPEMLDNGRSTKRELAFQLFKSHPLLGVGTNQYRVFESDFTNIRGLHSTNPHNIYLQILCENGIFCFMAMIAAIIQLFDRAKRYRDDIAMCILVIYLVIGWTLGITGSVRITGLAFALLATAYPKQREVKHVEKN